MDHSEISPSMLYRILGPEGCTASVQASRGVEDRPPSPAALLGDAYHRAAEVCLRTGTEPDEDVAEIVQPYLDYIECIFGSLEEPTLLVERRVSLEPWVPGMFGTADAVILGYRAQPPYCLELHVVDLKTGMRPVPAAKNPQLMAYALGAMQMLFDSDDLPDRFRRRAPQSAHLHICQPSLDRVDRAEVSRDSLRGFGDQMSRAAAKALGPRATYRPSETNCRWCPAAPTCPALHRQMVETVGGDFDDLPDPDEMTDEELATVVLRQSEVERWMKRVREYATQRAQAGNPVAGTKLVEGRSRRQWKEGALEELRSMYGDEVIREQLITITEADKVFGKRMTARYTVPLQYGPKLVGLDDKRPAIQAAADDFAAITTEKD